MCFEIARKQVKWKQKRVYKVVVGGPIYQGPHYPTAEGYEIGKVKRVTGAKRVGGIARAGVYVYKTLNIARTHYHNRHSPIYYTSNILRITVNPKDFLVHSTDGQKATYRAVKPTGVVSNTAKW